MLGMFKSEAEKIADALHPLVNQAADMLFSERDNIQLREG